MADPDFPLTALAMLERAGAEAAAAGTPEEAMRAIAGACFETLGDRAAHERPGALKEGERQYFVAGTFFVTPDRQHHMLVGSIGFPPEQRRLMVPIDGGHPARVMATRKPLLLANTDEDTGFRQYLKSSRMGSSAYAPMLWRGAFIGQLIIAAQARNTLRPEDLAALATAAHLAAAAWMGHNGPAWLAANADPADGYRVARQGL
jgi:hypothetical protein